MRAPTDDPDRDGVRGAADQCPSNAEDIDRVADDDGCPEIDQDCDRIADTDDHCPTQSEDRDQWQDDDGCPDPDNDRDTIVDRCDRCPSEAGAPGSDGCPEPRRIVINQESIRILPNVHFASGSTRIEPGSEPVIDAVVTALREHREIELVAVVGHSDRGERGGARLSEARATAVRDWMVRRGVEPARMIVRGEGATRPLDEGTSPTSRARNRRVQWIIERSTAQAPSERPRPIECPPEPTIAPVAGGCALPAQP